MNYRLEVIAFKIESCSIIQHAGAHRIELCDNPAEGGTTPSYGFLKKARELVSIDLYPMIRPRGGDFFYSADEYDAMQEDIKLCKQLGCEGVVFGLLNTDGTIDKNRTAALIELAYPMQVTFHRAFDRTRDAFEALETLIEIGCERILTSGLTPNVTAGTDMLSQLIKAADDRIIIMPGSGVKSNNIAELAKQTGAVEFHTSARTNAVTAMNYQNPFMQEELSSVIADEKEIIACLQQLNQLQQTIS
ncbi:MAG: copper homeostasis protein CutC [Chitinophagaceae bacterium]|jgi:copper homeostasis protein|nr:copper homeostasis protein CutC [Chitinophagaceae bacterium]